MEFGKLSYMAMLPEALPAGVTQSLVTKLREAGCGVTCAFGATALLPTDETSMFAAETALPLIREHDKQVVMYLMAEESVKWVN